MLAKLLSFVVAFASVVAAGNNALNVNTADQNDKHVDEHITTRGSNFLYAMCAVMGLTALAIIVAGKMQKRRSPLIFYWITAAINLTACIAYFAMGKSLPLFCHEPLLILDQVPTWAGLPLMSSFVALALSSVASTVRCKHQSLDIYPYSADFLLASSSDTLTVSLVRSLSGRHC